MTPQEKARKEALAHLANEGFGLDVRPGVVYPSPVGADEWQGPIESLRAMSPARQRALAAMEGETDPERRRLLRAFVEGPNEPVVYEDNDLEAPAPRPVAAAPKPAPRPKRPTVTLSGGPTAMEAPESIAALARGGPNLSARAPGASSEVAQGGARVAAESFGAPASAPAGDEDFRAAQDEARQRRLAAQLGRAGSMVAGAISGVSADGRLYDSLEEGADSPVKEYLARKDADAKQAKAAEEAARNSPDSEASRRFQAGVRKTLGGIYSEEEIAGMTAADADTVFKYGEMKASLDERRAARVASEEEAGRARTHSATEAEKARTFQGAESARQRALQRKLEGERTAAAKSKAEAEATASQRAASAKAETDLRKELSGLPEVKAFNEVAVSYDKIKRAAAKPSAAGDLAMIFATMKMLDPGSTVREGEFANAQNAAGMPDRIVSQYNKILTGERLGEPQRADFLNLASSLYASHEAQVRPLFERYRGLASKAGATPENVVFDSAPASGGGQPGAQAKRVGVNPETGEELPIDSPEEEALFRQNGWAVR